MVKGLQPLEWNGHPGVQPTQASEWGEGRVPLEQRADWCLWKECWEWALPVGSVVRERFGQESALGAVLVGGTRWEKDTSCSLRRASTHYWSIANEGMMTSQWGRHYSGEKCWLCALSKVTPVVEACPVHHTSFFLWLPRTQRRKETGKTWQLHAMLDPGQSHGPERKQRPHWESWQHLNGICGPDAKALMRVSCSGG